MIRSAQWPNCDGPRRCRGTNGKFELRLRSGYHPRPASSCCRGVCAPGRARMKCVVANGIVPFLEISHNPLKNGCLIHYVNNLVLAQREPIRNRGVLAREVASLNSQKLEVHMPNYDAIIIGT